MDIDKLTRIEAMPDGPRKTAIIAKLRASGEGGASRLFVGKQAGISMLALEDAKGRPRLLLEVTPEGKASIQFLDDAGKTVRTVTPAG
ncbi:MAG: hypothetical protein ACR2F8_02830 [Caulobacteraceae bacterium]